MLHHVRCYHTYYTEVHHPLDPEDLAYLHLMPWGDHFHPRMFMVVLECLKKEMGDSLGMTDMDFLQEGIETKNNVLADQSLEIVLLVEIEVKMIIVSVMGIDMRIEIMIAIVADVREGNGGEEALNEKGIGTQRKGIGGQVDIGIVIHETGNLAGIEKWINVERKSLKKLMRAMKSITTLMEMHKKK